MPWLTVLMGYLLGSIPTAYIAGRLVKVQDIRQVGDGNMGAQNVFRQMGHKVGVVVGLLDASKGALAILLAQAFSLPQPIILTTGAAAVIGHNWPIFLGFRGGRGESTTIGILLALVPLPMLIVGGPAILALLITRNVILASAILFVPLPLVCWLLDTPVVYVAYSVALPCLVGFTHFLRTRRVLTKAV